MQSGIPGLPSVLALKFKIAYKEPQQPLYIHKRCFVACARDVPPSLTHTGVPAIAAGLVYYTFADISRVAFT